MPKTARAPRAKNKKTAPKRKPRVRIAAKLRAEEKKKRTWANKKINPISAQDRQHAFFTEVFSKLVDLYERQLSAISLVSARIGEIERRMVPGYYYPGVTSGTTHSPAIHDSVTADETQPN